MTISFRCPHCDALCAFVDKYSGRRAKCVTCQKKFIIPDKSDVKPVKIKEKIVIPEKPKPGFYKASLIGSWTAIFSTESIRTLIHLLILAFTKVVVAVMLILWINLMPTPDTFGGVFLFVAMLPVLVLLTGAFFACFGRIIEIYMFFIDETACDVDQLPPHVADMDMPLWNHMLKPFFVFFLSLFGAFLPYIIGRIIFQHSGIEAKSVFKIHQDINIVLQILWLISVISIPSVFIHISMTRDFESLRPDKIFKPIIKAFIPYMFLTAIFALVLYLESKTSITKALLNGDLNLVAIKGVGNIAAQIIILFAARTAGLFFRHYQCYFKI